MPSPLATRVAGLGMGLMLGAAAAELAVRWTDPPPRTQIIRRQARAMDYEFVDLHGTPSWRTRSDWAVLRDPPCLRDDPATTRTLALVGDSILYITGTQDPADNLAPKLQALLDATGERWCVVNVAFPGYSAEQKRAELEDLFARAQVDVVLWEVWGEQPAYHLLDGDLYGVSTYDLDDEGYPRMPGGWVPDAVNRVLFRWSRAWEYTVLALGWTGRFGDARPDHAAAIAAAEAEGAEIGFFFATDLTVPLDQPAPAPNPEWPAWREALVAQGAPVLDLRERLVGEDLQRIRLTNCHYTAAGHDALARVLFGWLGELEAGRQADAGAAMP